MKPVNVSWSDDGCQVRGDAACVHMAATSFEHSRRLLASRPACINALEIDSGRYLHGLTKARSKALVLMHLNAALTIV
jgi:hypothetical protein